MSGAAARDLDTDLDAIRDWGATAVVTLITDEEIDHQAPGADDSPRERFPSAPPGNATVRGRVLPASQAPAL